MRLENQNPTAIEKLLFEYGGFYPVEKDDIHIRYIPIHLSNGSKSYKNYPEVIEYINENDVEWGSELIFHLDAELVTYKDYGDIDMFKLIIERMKELDFQMVFMKEG